MQQNYPRIAQELYELLRLRSTPVGIKMIRDRAELEAIPKLRRPTKQHLACQIMGQAIQMGYTTAFTAENLPRDNCKGICGLMFQDDKWKAGRHYAGLWFETEQDAKRHQDAVRYIPAGTWDAVVVSPLASNRIDPDVCLICGEPGQMFMLLSGYVRSGFEPIACDFIGESSCSATWVRAFLTGKPGLSLPCFAEMRYGGFSPGEMILGISPDALVKALQGVRELGKAGFRYPVPSYAVQQDVLEGISKTYTGTAGSPKAGS